MKEKTFFMSDSWFCILKKWLRAHPRLYRFYAKLRYGKFAATREWVIAAQKFISQNGLNCFVICKDVAYVRVFDDVEFRYVPELFGGLLGLEQNKGFEGAELDFLLAYLPEDSMILDIGANFGFYSVVLAKKVSGIKIHSFEPVPSTCDLLSQNICHNRVAGSVSVNSCAVSKDSGHLMVTTDRYAGNYLLSGASSHKGDSIRVPVTTVDAYIEVQSIAKVDFIKCDIEGAELLMLQGARNTLERDHPLLMLEIAEEWAPRFGYEAWEVFGFLHSLGYRAAYCQGDKGLVAWDLQQEKVSPLPTNNFIFYHGTLPETCPCIS